MELHLKFRNATKTCYRFESRSSDGNLTTLYLKKTDVDAAGIKPQNGIMLTIKEDITNAES